MKNVSPDEFMSLVSTAQAVTGVQSQGIGRSELSRKDFAAHVRSLFKSLGIKGVSVTAPNYSMAQAIDIRLPGIERPAGGISNEEIQKLWESKEDFRDALRSIMEEAYPNHGSRSDVYSDYFDFKYSIN